MLEHEPNSGADGTAGTTEATESNQPITTAAPQAGEVRVSAPTKRRSGVRSAGPPPEPEPVAAPVGTPLTSIAGDIDPDTGEPAPPSQTEVWGHDHGADGTETRDDGPAGEAQDTAEEVEEEATGDDTRTPATRSPRTARTRTSRSAATTTEGRPAGDDKTSAAVRGAATGVPKADNDVTGLFQPPMVLFQPPVASAAPTHTRDDRDQRDDHGRSADDDESTTSASGPEPDSDDSDEDRPSRRRRRRGGRGRGKSRTGEDESTDADSGTAVATGSVDDGSGAGQLTEPAEGADDLDVSQEDPAPSAGEPLGTRRRRRRRRTDGDETQDATDDDPPNTVVKVRERKQEQEKPAKNEVQSVKGSTRLEAKKQRRREGREQGRRRAPVITESEFLARRESVKRDLVIRRNGDRTQIAVLEDDVLVEHYVDRAAHKSYVGNVYLGRVQNVLPSMEAAFVDIGKGRNAVLYAGEVNWDASGLEGQPKRIESVLKSGQSVLVQVTKDPLGHKGARLTSQTSLPGRYLVYVPDGSMTGISRKLPDKERARLKQILKKVMPENAGVIVRTAAEGASEEELERDISRLASQWESIKRKSRSATAPALLSSEPDLTVRVVRDVFNEDFTSLVVSGEEAWSTVKEYVDYVAPHLAERLTHWDGDRDVFEAYRVDEQIAKALERKVWLPSGGSLIIDRTEAMTVVDVNTGKFTGQGGNLEETVTKNNLEAAEEIVRQLRLRDIGGIIVIDFIDMVLESNRDLVLRRMLECLSRDRTKHQVAEVTSLGLVQMTRKRVGQGLLEAFSHTCETCNGRGLVLSTEPVESKGGSGGGTGAGGNGNGNGRKKKSKGGADKTTRSDGSESAEVAEETPIGEGTSEPVAEAEQTTPGAPTTGAKSGQVTKGTTRKENTGQSARRTKETAATNSDPAGTVADTGAVAQPEAEPATGDTVESATADAANEAESGGERPRRRRTRRTKNGTASETSSAPASSVAEAG